MIIKKKYTQQPSRPVASSSLSAMGKAEATGARAAMPADPYQESLSPEMFETGLLPNRRRQERRTGRYRRIEDQGLISQAHEEANAIREAAAQQGFEEGMAQAQQVILELQETIRNLLRAREDALLSVADDLAAIAVEIAERIIKTEVSCDETLVMAIVRNTIAKVGREQKSILIKVNPADLKVVKETLKADPQISESVEILVVEDASVDAGSCMVETQAGLIDARFGTQWEVLKRMLLTGGKF